VHLIVDGYGGSREKLMDEDLVHSFLDQYPDVIGMTKIMLPQTYTYHGKTPEDWGVSGFVLIAESHISIHTFPDKGYMNLDIFSCKEFDSSTSLDDIRSTFSLSDLKVWTLERGLEYSNEKEAYKGMMTERVGLITGAEMGDAR